MKRGVSYIELKKAFTKLLPQSIEIENEVLLKDLPISQIGMYTTQIYN